MVGSSFLSPAEQNYAAIEEECLAVVNALYKTRYYTLGCDKLLVCTDHKLLLPVISTSPLENIDNPRLMQLVQKTMSWKFSVLHIPEIKLGGPDALSRHVPKHTNYIPGATQSVAWDILPCSNIDANLPRPPT